MPQVADIAVGLQMWDLAGNMLNTHLRPADKGFAAACRLVEVLQLLTIKQPVCYQMLHSASDLRD